MGFRYLLGIDIGSSSIKTALVDIDSGAPVANAFSPATEMTMISHEPGFAEQEPELWWQELINCLQLLKKKKSFAPEDIAAIGISYQMHGLVCVDRHQQPLRPSIIWCDSRAVATGNHAFQALGEQFCLKNFLNSPGNFTASKLKWVKDHEPAVYEKIDKVMLPGDYIAMRLTGKAATTVSGLSEGILWNFSKNRLASELLDQFGIDESVVCDTVDTFGLQGTVSAEAAKITGLKAGTPVSYRAGDQPNNACALNVLEPGEIAATAGTSGVVYGVTDTIEFDPASRVNTFAHVNSTADDPRYGILLCINGTGILNSWLRKNVFDGLSYEQINQTAADVEVGAEGLLVYPFGNGAERVLLNNNPGASVKNLQFNTHHRGHLARAAQEGIVFSMYYGVEIMQQMGLTVNKVRAGYANMFLSEVFSEAFANTTGAALELYDTDGATGAARAAGMGAGIYSDFRECFRGMKKIGSVDPSATKTKQYAEGYVHWKSGLDKL